MNAYRGLEPGREDKEGKEEEKAGGRAHKLWWQLTSLDGAAGHAAEVSASEGAEVCQQVQCGGPYLSGSSWGFGSAML